MVRDGSPICSTSSPVTSRSPAPKDRSCGPDGRVDIDHHLWVGDEFALPQEGAVLAVTSGSDQLGWFSLVPGRPIGVPLEARRVAVALARQLANALAHDETTH